MVIAPKMLFEHNNFAGGLNTQYSPFQLEDNESPDCQNVLFDSKGTIKKVRGFSKANTVEIVADKGIYGLIPYYRYTDATKRLIAMCDTQLWKWTGGASFTSIKTGLTADEMIQGTTFMDLCLIVKESDNPMTYDGTDVLDLGGSPPKGKYITHHVRRIFISGNSSYPNRLYFSNAGDYEIWGVNDYLEIDPIKGDVINGINVVLDSVIMYTDNCIFVLDTQDSSVVTDWIVKRVSTDVGCVAPYTLETVKENTVFWSNLGINTLGGVLAKEAYDFDQIKTGLLSDKITNYIKEFNQVNIGKSCSISFDYKLWLSGPYGSDTTNSRVVVYDYINNCWSRIKGMNASCFALYKAQDDEDLYFGSPTNGYVYKYGGCDSFDKDPYIFNFAEDNGKWSFHNASITGGVLDITAMDGYGQRSPDADWNSGANDDFEIEIDFKQDFTTNWGTAVRIFLENGSPMEFRVIGYYNDMRIRYLGQYRAEQTFVDDIEWHTMKIRRVGTVYYMSIDGGSEISWDLGTARAIDYIQLQMDDCTGDFDNFKYSYRSNPIESYYRTKPFSLENPGQLKRYWNYMVLVGDTGNYNLTVGYSVDFNASFENTDVKLTSGLSLWDQAKWDIDYWDVKKDISIKPVTMKGERGRYISFRFENLQANQYYEVYALLLKFSVKMFMKEKGE